MVLSDIDDPHFDGYLFKSIPYDALFEKETLKNAKNQHGA